MIITKLFVALLPASVIYAAPTSSSSVTSSAKPSSTVAPSSTPAANATQTGYSDLKALFDGNARFRSKFKANAGNFTSKPPPFMFIGCSDNRVGPGAIFHAPAGAIVAQSNIGNQYSNKDLGINAALTYAIQDMKVQHVIILGHYGCKGVETAITSAQQQTTSVQKWVKPIIDIFKHSKRNEIKVLRDLRKPQRNKKDMVTVKPKADNPGFKALVEENVKQNVDRIKKQSILATVYKKGHKKNKQQQEIEVYVHGFVYDESSGEVRNLRVSFGPPGKKIPDVPFSAIDAAKNWHGPKWLPGINKGKKVKTVTASKTGSASAPTQSKK